MEKRKRELYKHGYKYFFLVTHILILFLFLFYMRFEFCIPKQPVADRWKEDTNRIALTQT